MYMKRSLEKQFKLICATPAPFPSTNAGVTERAVVELGCQYAQRRAVEEGEVRSYHP